MAELRLSEVGHSVPERVHPNRRVPCVERVDIQIFYAVASIEVMERTALTQRNKQKPIAVHGQAWSSREHGGLVFERNLSQAIKVRIRERRTASVGPPGD